jgi:hypothetical protein
MDGVLAKDKALAVMNQKADALSKDFQTLMAQADEMARKQGAVEALGERLAQVDELGRRTAAQADEAVAPGSRRAAPRHGRIPEGARRGGAAA